MTMSAIDTDRAGPRFIYPDWPAPAAVHAVSSTRGGGYSQGLYAGLNLGAGCGDQPRRVARNRRLFATAAALPGTPVWLRQVHGRVVVDAAEAGDTPEADASYSRKPEVICTVLSADCLPVLLCDERGSRVAAAHAGWRGLAGGVLEATVEALQCRPEYLLAWLGPAIGPSAYQVGDEVRDHFIAADANARQAFTPSPPDRWLADLYGLARLRLERLGLKRIYGGGFCTFSNPRAFYSHRRDGACGRMATCIWLQK